jgi:hypothetical protein
MRVAVLLTGMPRFLEQGAWWFKNRVFPKDRQIKVDYYCHFWNDGSENLETRIIKTFDPVKLRIEDYGPVIDEFIYRVRQYNKNTNWDFVPDKYRNNQLFDTYTLDQISDYNKNFWGQYLAASRLTAMTGDLSGQYDIVIKGRSDLAFNDMEERYWLDAFNNMNRNPVFHDKMLSNWLYIDKGIPYFGDFAFISKPNVWYNYSKDISEHCFRLAGPNKQLWYEIEVSKFTHEPHWVWNKLSMYSQTNWLSFSTVWPMPFDATLIRHRHDLFNSSFGDLKSKFDQYQAENPTK